MLMRGGINRAMIPHTRINLYFTNRYNRIAFIFILTLVIERNCLFEALFHATPVSWFKTGRGGKETNIQSRINSVENGYNIHRKDLSLHVHLMLTFHSINW